MTDNLQLFARLAGRDIAPAAEQFEELSEIFQLRLSVAASTTNLSVPLTGISTPKVIVVRGDKGIVVKINSETDGHSAYPLFVESKLDDKTVSALTISNSDTKAHDVYIWAAQ